MKLLVTLIGLVFILEGLPYVTFPEKMREWFKRLIEMTTAQLRMVGLLAMILGFIICYIAQQTNLLD